jgi:hypothetical protein
MPKGDWHGNCYARGRVYNEGAMAWRVTQIAAPSDGNCHTMQGADLRDGMGGKRERGMESMG